MAQGEKFKNWLRKYGLLYSWSGLYAKDMGEKALKQIEEMEIRHTEEMKRLWHDAIVQATYNAFYAENRLIPIKATEGEHSEVEAYWTGHTVRSDMFTSAEESLNYMTARLEMYPFFREFAGMDENHDGKVLLDYGCGPGNDLSWFYTHNRLKQLHGMDVSAKALSLSQFRLALHGATAETVQLYKLSDKSPVIPLEDDSVDFINCQGVLMHTSYPEDILKEFRRVLRPSGRACIMVYNRSSLWYHLYAAYFLRYVDPSWADLTFEMVEQMPVDEIFRRSTDGVDCPKADCYTPEFFTEMCRNAGFEQVDFVGGYPNKTELRLGREALQSALEDSRLEAENRQFLTQITFNEAGYPIYNNKLASLGGVYHLS